MDVEGLLRSNFFFTVPAVSYRPSKTMEVSEKPGYESKTSCIRSGMLPTPSRPSVGVLFFFPKNLVIGNSITDTFVMKVILLCFYNCPVFKIIVKHNYICCINNILLVMSYMFRSKRAIIGLYMKIEGEM